MAVGRRSYNIDATLLKLVDIAQCAHGDNWCETKEQIIGHAIHVAMHQLASKDPQTRLRLERLGGSVDPRVGKNCFGGLCICCKFHSQCKLGRYTDGYVEADCA